MGLQRPAQGRDRVRHEKKSTPPEVGMVPARSYSVHNEESALPVAIGRLYRPLNTILEGHWRITVVNNGSTDGTLEIAHQLAGEHENICILHLDQKGRGRALKQA